MKKIQVTIFSDLDPTPEENTLTGYALGQWWHNLSTGNKFYHKTEGVWQSLVAIKTSDLINDGEGSTPFLTKEIDEFGNVIIDEISLTPPFIDTVTQPTLLVTTGSVDLSGLPVIDWEIIPSPNTAGLTGLTGSTSTTTIDNLEQSTTYTFQVLSNGDLSVPSDNVVVNSQPGIQSPIIGEITQPTCDISNGSVALSGLPTIPWTITAYPNTPGITGLTGSTSTSLLTGLQANTTYTFSVSNGFVLSADSDSVIINQQPVTPTVPTIGVITQPSCASITGTFQIVGYNSANTYNFTPSVISISGTGLVTAIAQTYTFTVTNVENCTSPISDDIVIDIQPITPTAPIVSTIIQPTFTVATGSVLLQGLPNSTWTIIATPSTIGLTGLTGNTSTSNVGGLIADTTYTFALFNGDCVSDQSESVVIEPQPIPTDYYVRPLGTTYGDGSGTSYVNAWSGFSAINWNVLENKNLNVIGTHYEELNVQKNSVTIIGNNVNGAGIIDAQNTRVCFRINGYNNITINSLTMNNGLVSNAFNMKTTGTIYNNCIFDTSGNQTTQHEGNIISDLISVTYNGCTFKNGTDDGVSLHGENTTVVLNNCSIENNSQGVNAINTGICIMNDCNFLNNVTDIQPDSSSDFTANRCTFRNLLSASSTVPMKLNNCTMLSGVTNITSLGAVLIQDTKYLGSSQITSNRNDITKVVITRCYFEITSIVKVTAINNGVYDVSYSVFNHTSGTNLYGASTVGTNISVINNCTFVGLANTGRGILGQGRVNVKNTIFTKLNLVTNPNGVNGIVTFDKCCLYLNTTTNVNQNGGTFTNTNPITTNPLIADVTNLDFSLTTGSSCWNTGLTLTNSTGILSANWVTGMPTVTTKTQPATWDIGAYIH